MTTPTVFFGYLNMLYIEHACKQYAGMPFDKLKTTLTQYAPIKSNSDDREIVTIGQLLYSDIELAKRGNVSDYNKLESMYNTLVNTYGQEFIDLIITKDEDRVVSSIAEVLDFIMDKVYKTNELKVSFLETLKDDVYKSNYPSLIYSAIQQHFIIKDQIFHYGGRTIVIRKRSK